MRLRLRPLAAADEAEVRAAHDVMQPEGFTFCIGIEPDMTWSGYLDALDATQRGEGLRSHLVPSTFLVADVDGTVVGRLSFRHELNEFLRIDGGHLGYCVLPEHRRRGYATAILESGITLARSNGIDDILVTCDDDNTASAAVIERCGGELDSLVTREHDGKPVRRYWIRADEQD